MPKEPALEEETSEEDIVRTFMRVVFECSKLLCDHCARNGGARTNSKDVFEFLNKVRQNPSMLIPLIEQDLTYFDGSMYKVPGEIPMTTREGPGHGLARGHRVPQNTAVQACSCMERPTGKGGRLACQGPERF
jgi:hypothetical protein